MWYTSVWRGKKSTKPVWPQLCEGLTQKQIHCRHTYWNKRKVPSGTIHNLIVMCESLQRNKKNECLTFRLQLVKDPHNKMDPEYLNLHTGTHRLERIPATRKNSKLQRLCIVYTQHWRKRKNSPLVLWLWSCFMFDWLLQELPHKSKHMTNSFDKL
jgi:hypothetical protein